MIFLGLSRTVVAAIIAGGLVVAVLLYLRQWGRRRVTVAFSPLWKRVLTEADVGTRRRRVLELLSLIVQAAIIVLLALALGRPLVGRKPGVHVVVLDTSASMLGKRPPRGDRLAAAKQAAFELLDRVSDDDQVALVTTGGEARLLFAPTRDHYAVRRRIAELEGCACEGRLREGIDIARSLTSDLRSIEVLTDGNETLEDADKLSVRLFGAPASNIGITVLGVRAAAATPGRYDGLLEVQSFASSAARGQLRVSVDGQLVQLVDVRLQPGERQSVVLPPLTPGRGEGLLKAELYNVEIDGALDSLSEDDVAYALLSPQVEYPVRLLAPKDGARFVREVLRANPKYRIVDVDPADAQTATEAAAITVVAQAPVPQGPGRYLVLGATGGKTTPLPDAIFTDWRTDHPVLAHASLLDIAIKTGEAMRPPEGAQILARYGDVALLYVSQRLGRTEVGTTFDVESSNLPLRVAFPVLVYNALDWMLGVDELDAIRTLGRRWHLARVGSSAVAKVTVDGPSRHVEATASGDSIVVENANAPGLYRITAGDETFRVAASLTSVHESDLRTRTVAGAASAPLPRASDLWSWLVYAAAALLALEWTLYHRRVTS